MDHDCQYNWKRLVLESKRNSISLESGTKKFTSVTNDGGRNMYGSKIGIAVQICKEIIKKKSSGNLICFTTLLIKMHGAANFFIGNKRSYEY
jgi:hypothetical protein